jgi:flagellar basal body-associated protein FliL
MNQIMAKMEDIKDECHKLDDLDDRIRDLLIHKSQDSLTRAEPIFQAKQKLTDQLNHKLKSQNQMK